MEGVSLLREEVGGEVGVEEVGKREGVWWEGRMDMDSIRTLETVKSS